MTPSILAGLALVLGCATRSLPDTFPKDSAASLSAHSSEPQKPTGLTDDWFALGVSSSATTSESPGAEHASHAHSASHHDHAGADVEADGDGNPGQAPTYACPMHPEETSQEPGRCSVCGMNLKRVE